MTNKNTKREIVEKEKGSIDEIHLQVKNIRKNKGITLKQLSEDSGLSLSYLSNYENGKVNITLKSLKKIAEALEVYVIDLINEEVDSEVAYVPKKDRSVQFHYKSKRGRAYREYLMHSNKAAMQVSMGTLPAHSDSGEWSQHPGEEFVIAMKGIVTVFFNNKKYTLAQGDMLYFKSTIPHKLGNEQDDEVEYLLVNTPPTF